MMWTNFSTICLGLSLLLSGFYGGTGFFTLMGGNPALARLKPRAFAEYWQLLDGYMGARMPVFGPILLLTLLVTILSLPGSWESPTFWLMILAFLILTMDIVFTLSTNHPMNKLIQSWDLEQLPDNVVEIQAKVVNAFWYRSIFMIATFLAVILAVLCRVW